MGVTSPLTRGIKAAVRQSDSGRRPASGESYSMPCTSRRIVSAAAQRSFTISW